MSTAVEDRICVALLFCATFGVGAMSFGSIFAATGPLVASLAMYFLSACNLHASIAVSKSMTIVPTSVRTFSDLGYYAFGDLGRKVVLISEGGACFLSPIAFLILGGTKLLPTIFANVDGAAQTETTWIIVMALGVLPVVLIPTLKGTGVLCYIGAAVAVLCDVICIVYSLTSLPFLPRETELAMDNAISTFGTIMFAMGTAIIIPPIQRQHTDPVRLGNLVGLTLLMITSLYMIIGIVTYYQYGCTAPTTLLDQLPPGKWSQLAAALMFIHITIAFPVMLNPALFDLERYLLGKDADIEVLQQSIVRRAEKMAAGKPILGHAPTIASLDDDGFLYGRHHSPGGSRSAISSSPSTSTIAGSATNGPDYFQYQSPTGSTISSHDATTSGLFSGEDYSDVTFTPMDRVFSILIRTLTIGIQCFLAIAFQSSFLDILSLIGATVITITCMIMPCLCYLKVYPIPIETFMGRCDRALCYIIIITTTCLGLYCTVLAAGNIQNNINKYALFGPPLNSTITVSDSIDGFDNDPVYPYCHMGEQN